MNLPAVNSVQEERLVADIAFLKAGAVISGVLPENYAQYNIYKSMRRVSNSLDMYCGRVNLTSSKEARDDVVFYLADFYRQEFPALLGYFDKYRDVIFNVKIAEFFEAFDSICQTLAEVDGVELPESFFVQVNVSITQMRMITKEVSDLCTQLYAS